MKDDLIFVGYRQFNSKKNNQDYFVIDFISKPKKSALNNNVTVSNIAVFTDKEKFSEFVQSHKLLETISVPFEIQGDKVKYFI